MEKMGFNQKFINLIKTLYENIKVKAVTNGTLCGDINMERGIKQGCPLSSYLYIMYIEPLMRKLQAELKGIRVGSTTYKTSGFIDDLRIYASEKEDVVALNDTINKFEKMTNSKINREKTQVLKMGDWENSNIKEAFWFKGKEKPCIYKNSKTPKNCYRCQKKVEGTKKI